MELSRQYRLDNGLDGDGYCDRKMVAEWKLEMMAKQILSEVWGNRKDAVILACSIIQDCKTEELKKASQNLSIKLKEKLNGMYNKIDKLF